LAAESLWLVDRPNRAAIAALAALLKDRDEFLAGMAAQALGRAGPAARGALPALREATAAGSAVSVYAAEALWKIERQAGVAVPTLVKALRGKSRIARWAAAEVLAGMGREARGAAPALMEALRDEDETLQGLAAEALKKIDPQAAAKAGVR
jgi:HEAT repeat protein